MLKKLNDLNNIESSLTLQQPGYLPNSAPFNRTNIPIYALINAAPVNNWGIYENAASSPPLSPACINDEEIIMINDEHILNKKNH